MHIAIYVLLLFCACSDRSTGPIARAVETGVERWPNGRLRAEYRYFVDGKGEIIRHGYYREYSRLSAGLLIAEDNTSTVGASALGTSAVLDQ